MVYLLLSILSSTAIYIVFKLINRYKVFTFSAIIVNYFAACLAGFFLSSSNPFSLTYLSEKWLPIAVVIGVMFIIMFFVIGKSTQNAGVGVTSVAVKMSVVFPIAFSIWYDITDPLTLLKFFGIALALPAVVLTAYKGGKVNVDRRAMLLPLFLFVGMGAVDSFVKYSQSEYINNELAPIFSALIFAASALVGVLTLPFNRKAFIHLGKIKTWLLGIILGLVNFGSIYFLVLALNHIDVDTGEQAMGSVVFGINNIGIVVLSVIIGFIIFGERPNRTNWLGIGLSLLAIFILSIS